MSGVLIANKDEKISISAPDIYGASFKISIFSQETNLWVLSNEQMIEYTDPVPVVESSSAEDRPKDSSTLEIQDASNFIAGEIIKIKNFIYRILKKENNTLFLHKPLFEDIEIDDVVTLVGNMSLYYINVNLPDSGDYLIRAKDNIFSLDITDSIKVVPKSIERMVNDIKTLEYAILGS
jgi:hypothetical protein